LIQFFVDMYQSSTILIPGAQQPQKIVYRKD
jgi:hypothetical protein